MQNSYENRFHAEVPLHNLTGYRPAILSTILMKSNNSSVIRQKGESQNGCLKKKNKARQIFRKTNISYPLIRTRM